MLEIHPKKRKEKILKILFSENKENENLMRLENLRKTLKL